ncbi:Gfo/Idh/MocA family protein [Paenibacillus sp. y28]|uniref:Gfo/Idh/MocA family protein n=1 Tax=Paenibacillus sp. y28 TaxID=3129110 RepID=UPI0030163A01
MKAVLVGLGQAGFKWFKRLQQEPVIVAAVVERNESMKQKLEGTEVPFYTSLEAALEEHRPDFLVNVTSPMAHTVVNRAAFERGIPVLCEKPISFDYEESIEIVKLASALNIPFMIAENYRCQPSVRKLKQLIDAGAIGQISHIEVLFSRYHRQPGRQYPVHLLNDIGIHHFDMIRYLTGVEARAVRAELYQAAGGWNEEGAVTNAHVFMELERDIRVHYSGSLTSRSTPTTWRGMWRIEGTEGSLELGGSEVILVCREGTTKRLDNDGDISAPDTLTEFLAALGEGREPESSGRDYMKSQAMVHYANESGRTGQKERILLPLL